MIVPAEIRRSYDDVYSLVKAAGERVKDIVQGFCSANDYLFEGRIKSIESLTEKIESGRYSRWSDIDDLYACTAVIPLVDEEPKVLDFLRSRFREVRLTRRQEVSKPPDTFRFDATRFIGLLQPADHPASGEAQSIYSVHFEVQIQTIFDFAWSKTTHALAYKTSSVDWRRYRLAAHLKAAVEQLDMLVLGFDKAAELIGDGTWADIDDKAEILRFFTDLDAREKLPREVIPKDWSRFCDNVYRALQAMQGESATGRSRRRLRILTEALEILTDFFEKLSLDTFPYSVSLFQITVGALVASGRFRGRVTGYFLPVTDGFRAIFPKIEPPSEEFSFE